MADPTVGSVSTEEENTKSENGEKRKEENDLDPDFLTCLLQPSPPDVDPNYIGIRRLLLHRKAQAGQLNRKGWKCNGRGYVAYRNYINRPRNWENTQTPSVSSTPGHSGRMVASPNPRFPFYDADSWSTGRDMRSSSRRLSRSTSLSSNLSDIEYPQKKVEPAYSFVGMHCIFDQAKAMVTDLPL